MSLVIGDLYVFKGFQPIAISLYFYRVEINVKNKASLEG